MTSSKNKTYNIKDFIWDKSLNTFFGFEEQLIINYYKYPFPNKGKQFFIKNKKTKGFRRFRLHKESQISYQFKSEDGINCIVFKENINEKCN